MDVDEERSLGNGSPSHVEAAVNGFSAAPDAVAQHPPPRGPAVRASRRGAADRLPIIDMHLHALAADEQGPPPVAMCTPIEPFPAWDPHAAYGDTFMAMLKKPPCEDPVWSPTTDDELMRETPRPAGC